MMLKSWFFVLFIAGAAALSGGCAFLRPAPPMNPCESCPTVTDTLWVLQDTILLKTDTLIQENTLEIWKLQMLLDSIGSTFSVGGAGDTARIVFVRGKDGVIIRTIIKPITIERIRRDTIRVQIPGNCGGQSGGTDWSLFLYVAGLIALIVFMFYRFAKNERA